MGTMSSIHIMLIILHI